MNRLQEEFGFLHGIKIIAQPDYKIYASKLMKANRKYGPKMQRVKYWTGKWGMILEDGQVVEDRQRGVFYVNPRTKRDLERATECKAMGVG